MLINLEDAKLDEVVWVWPSFLRHSPGEVAHIYQFGLKESYWNIGGPHDDESPYPDPQPVCGAPAFARGSHNRLLTGTGMGGPIQCTWCLVSLVSNYPHLFTQGAT